MKLMAEDKVEIILENSIELDILPGFFERWQGINGTNYLVMRRKDGNRSYIAQRIIKVIHIFDPLLEE